MRKGGNENKKWQQKEKCISKMKKKYKQGMWKREANGQD